MLNWLRLRSTRGGRALSPPAGAALLFVVVDVAARLVLRLIAPKDQADLIFGLIVYGVVLLTAAAFGLVWVRRYLLARVWAYLLAAALAAATIIGWLGPWISGEEFNSAGAKVVALRMLLTLVVLVAGGAIGVLSTVALGQDPTSRAWKAQADHVLARRK